MASFVAIGNPGTGKSTILNALANEVLFKSGISFGRGLTTRLDKRINKYGTFYDTPGMADDTYRMEAAIAIRNALRKGGRFRLLFFLTTDAGRVVKQDITTMKLVLETVPEIRHNYGIIINKVSAEVARKLQREENLQSSLALILNGIDKDRICATSNIMIVQKIDELVDEDDILIDANEIVSPDGMTLDNFVYDHVPTVDLMSLKASNIESNEIQGKIDLFELMIG